MRAHALRLQAAVLLAAALLAAALLAAAVPAGQAEARLVELRIERREPFASGRTFGRAGPYVRMTGRARGELDPADRRNRVIADLDKAPRNGRGLVEYETDVAILAPADPAKGNRTLLYDVTNRGRPLLLRRLDEAEARADAQEPGAQEPGAANGPAGTAEAAGLGFTLAAGYTVVWSGWDPDAPRTRHGLRIRVPVATDQGRPIVKTVREEFVVGARMPAAATAAPLRYEAADLDPGKARLTVRARETDRPRVVPSSGWAYAGSKGIRLTPDGSRFEPGLIYDFRYPARDPKVLGVGFAATRDLVSVLRYERRDLGLRHALAVGIGQAGRYLREHVAMGMNADEAGRVVFDGILAHASGAGRLFANEPFAQPHRTSTRHEDHHFPEQVFPFAHGRMDDPVAGASGAILRGDGSDPLVVEVNTSTDYWQKGASLVHTDPLGREDAAIPPAVRVYLVAGTPHGGPAGLGTDRGPCLHPRNPHDPAPALRALLVALHRWVAEGVEPPASRVPTVAGGALVPAGRLRFPAIPGVAAPDASNHVALFGDWVDPAHRDGRDYVPLVPAVDADGNETAGVRLPDVAAPLGTYTGWNLYRAPYPEGELCDREGTFVPFARTRAEREGRADPRRSLEERYGSHEAYVAAVAAAADRLVEARLLLPDDAARYVARARSANPLAP